MKISKRLFAILMCACIIAGYMPVGIEGMGVAEAASTITVETAKAEKEKAAADLDAANEDLEKATEEYERADKAYADLLENNPDIKADYTSAQEDYSEKSRALELRTQELESAQVALDEAEKAVSDADGEYASAKKDYDAAVLNAEAAETAAAEAQEAFELAQKDYDAALAAAGADPEVISAKIEADEANAAVEEARASRDAADEKEKAALAAYEDAKAARQQADEAAGEAKTAEAPYMEAVETAGTEVEKAQAAKTEAEEKVDAAQKAYEESASDVILAEEAVKAAEGKAEEKQSLIDAATADMASAEAELAAAELDKYAAKQAKAIADEKLSEYQEEMSSKLNSYEFFRWLSTQSNQSETVRGSAAVAARMISNKMTSADNSASIHNDGTVSSSSGSPKSYSDIIGYTHIGGNGDATSWENFEFALSLVQKGNEYRAKESLTPLKVSSVMMAMGEINANYQKALNSYSISHSSAFLALENLAANMMGASYMPARGNYDPYEGWYTEEKKVYDYLKKKGWSLSSLSNAQKEEIRTQCGISEGKALQTGHYETLTDRQVKMISTGLGYVFSRDDTSSMHYLYEKYSQMFGYSRSYAGGQDGIPVDSYIALAKEYEDSFTAREKALMNDVADAQKDIEQAGAAIDSANDSISQAREDIDRYNLELNEATGAIADAKTDLELKREEQSAKEAVLQSAEDERDEKTAALESARDKLEEAESQLESKKAETAAAQKSADNAAKTLTDRESELAGAKAETAAAEKALSDAREAAAAKEQALQDAVENSNAQQSIALDRYHQAQEDYEQAVEELQKANAQVEEKNSALNAASDNLEKARKDKEQAETKVEEAEKNRNSAAGDVAAAEAALGQFKDLVDAGNALVDAEKKVSDAEQAVISANAKLEEANANYDAVAEADKKAREEADRKASEEASNTGEDGTPVGRGASIQAAEKAITGMKSDSDPKGTVFNTLTLRSAKETKTAITLKWKKVPGAVSYYIYGNKCGTANHMMRQKVTSGASLKLTKVTGNNNKPGKIKKGTYYKFVAVAVDKDGKVLSTSKVIHVSTKGGKTGNYKSVSTRAAKNKVTLKKGKKFKLAAKGVAQSKSLKVKVHRKIAYESSNSKIASVSSKGVIKGVKKGTCYVYAYSQSGTFAKIKVTVK